MAGDTKCLLVVDDEESICEMLEVAGKKWGFRVKTAKNLKEGLAAIERGKVDIVLCDIKLPDGSGVELLQRIKTLPEKPPVVLMTAFGSTDAAVQAMKMGAFYYITKPFKLEELRLLLERAFEDKTLKKENEALKSEVRKEFSAENILGKAKVMKQLFSMIDRVSKTKTNILITGESGTGKELVARAIHYGGVLKNHPFVAVNCGAIPETLIESELFGHRRGSFTGAVSDKDGLFRVADGGTIFLDEIGELPMTMQVKLLRVLQDRSFRPVGGTDNVKVDVRIISATNRNLEEGVAKGTFREDLYYRLNVIHIRTPSLRERKEDIPVLVDHFITKFSLGMGKSTSGLSAEALRAVMAYDFPGNVRELENMMERAVALEGGAEISLESLPPAVQKLVNAGPEATQSQNVVEEAPEAPIPSTAPRAAPRADLAVTRAPVVADPKSYRQAAEEALTSGPVDLEKIVGELEKEYILTALEKTKGVKKQAAELLGITFRSIRYRITKYEIQDAEGDVEDEG